MANKISITLTAYNMGADVTEADYDAWASWVCDHVDEACGVFVSEVEQAPFANGPDRDVVRGCTDEEQARILSWLAHEGWETFCADASAWPSAPEADICPVAVTA